MARATAPDLFVKKGLIEKRYELKARYIIKEEVDSIRINDLRDTYEIKFYHSDTIYEKANPLIVKITK